MGKSFNTKSWSSNFRKDKRNHSIIRGKKKKIDKKLERMAYVK